MKFKNVLILTALMFSFGFITDRTIAQETNTTSLKEVTLKEEVLEEITIGEPAQESNAQKENNLPEKNNPQQEEKTPENNLSQTDNTNTQNKTMTQENTQKEILTLKQKNIVLISSQSAQGDIKELEKTLNKALDEGLTINEIKEILIQIYAYCGFPRSLNALGAFSNVLDSRKSKNDPAGLEPQILPKKIDKFAYGDKVQVELTGNHVKGGIFDFTPAIDKFLKEHLFCDIFSRKVLTNQEREIATVSALSSLKGVESQLDSHIAMAKKTGVSEEEIQEILNITKISTSKNATHKDTFAIGGKNDAYAQYFKGQSYLQSLTTDGVNSANVTFEPSCRNNWHIHHKGGQILLVTQGEGYYQEWGKEAQSLKAGDVVNIPPEVKHWHGAKSNSWFSHIAIAIPADGASTEWLKEVSDEEYAKLK